MCVSLSLLCFPVQTGPKYQQELSQWHSCNKETSSSSLCYDGHDGLLRLTMAAESGHPTWSPLGAPASPLQQQQRVDDRSWGSRSFDNSVNAVSFGFVATAILISMFLVMAIFERFLRPNQPAPPAESGRRGRVSQHEPPGKLGCPSPKVSPFSPHFHFFPLII